MALKPASWSFWVVRSSGCSRRSTTFQNRMFWWAMSGTGVAMLCAPAFKLMEAHMITRKLTSALAIAALCASGSVFAATTSTDATSPSNTPNDTTATPPNQPIQPGEQSAAPVRSTNPSPASTTPVTPITPEGKGRAPSDMGNTNVSPTQGGAAPYTGATPQK